MPRLTGHPSFDKIVRLRSSLVPRDRPSASLSAPALATLGRNDRQEKTGHKTRLFRDEFNGGFFHFKGFNDVADFDIVIFGQFDPAFIGFFDLFYIILHAL